MNTPAPAVVANDLSHRFTIGSSSRQALIGVSFSVNPGEMVALLGPNGSGKTTLFRILATLLSPSSGDALVFGRSVAREPAAARCMMGVGFQQPSLDMQLTVMENLRHHGRLHGLRGGDLASRCRDATATLGVADRAHDRVASLSGGLRRRAELAKCLVHRPALLLLDEPSTGLDPNARREFMSHLADLRRRDGLTVLMTTHLMDEAERCDRVGILHEGRLAAFGEPARLKSQVGGDVVVVGCRDPARLRPQLGSRFGVDPTIVNGSLRLRRPGGHRLVEELVEAFPSEITSVTWGQPTLEDLFVQLTGRSFEAGNT